MNSVAQTLPGGEVEFEALVEGLRQLIGAGERLPAERALSERFGVNRHTLRKALFQLRSSGELSASSPRRQAAVARSGAALAHSTNPLEVVELRLMFEPMLARLAALRATPLEIARIEKAATTLAEDESAAADLTFHRLIAEATRNTLACEMYLMLRQVGADARIHVPSTRPRSSARLGQRDSEHRAVANAIAARDPDGAEKAMRAHLHMVQRQVLDRLSLQPGGSGE